MSDFYFIKETTGEQFREQARGRQQAAEDSFDRCDTDGFLSQWAAGQMSHIYEALAALADAGGEWTFTYLADLDGNLVNARQIRGKFGPCWMILDDEGKATGEFAPWRPAKESTLAKRGYKEVEVKRPACVRVSGNGGLSLSVHYYPIEWLNSGKDE